MFSFLPIFLLTIPKKMLKISQHTKKAAIVPPRIPSVQRGFLGSGEQYHSSTSDNLNSVVYIIKNYV